MLLIVTFLANFLSTTLPAQMAINDANHAKAVENQLSRVAAMMAAAAQANAVGAQLSQPISLGSQGLAPFAAPDTASIGPGVNGSQLTSRFAVVGPTIFRPPQGWAPGGNAALLKKCTVTGNSSNPTSVKCSSSQTSGLNLTQNFTGQNTSVHATGAGTFHLNYTVNYTTISVDVSGGPMLAVQLVGSHDVLYVNTSGVGSSNLRGYVNITGNSDTLYLQNSGGWIFTINVIGNNDTVVDKLNGGPHVTVSMWGTDDSYTIASGSGGTGTTVEVYYTGFDALNPTSSSCPYGDSALTDKVGGTVSGQSNFHVLYNTTNASAPAPPNNQWTTSSNHPVNLSCPFFTSLVLPQGTASTSGASFVVHLRNLYAPVADVAFDQGAVVYAQAGGVPVMVAGPGATFSHGLFSLWVPEFIGSMGSEVGASTASLSFHLDAVQSVVLPYGPFSLPAGQSVELRDSSPYAAAWMNYFASQPSLAGLLSTCIPSGAYPFGVVYDSGRSNLFVSNPGTNTVTVVSDGTNSIAATIPVGKAPLGLAYDKAKGEVFVANRLSNSVSVISDATNTVTHVIHLKVAPFALAYDSGKGEIFVTSPSTNTVKVINDTTNKVVATIPVGANPTGIVYDAAKHEVFVADLYANRISVISDSTNTVVARVSLPVASAPYALAYDSGKGEVFVADRASNSVTVISDATNSVVATIPVGFAPLGLTYAAGLGRVFVTDSRSGTISSISDASNTVVGTFRVGDTPIGVAYDSGKGTVVAANSGSGSLSVFSLASNTVVATVALVPAGTAPNACTGPFVFGGSLATVLLTIPASALIVRVATYSVWLG